MTHSAGHTSVRQLSYSPAPAMGRGFSRSLTSLPFHRGSCFAFLPSRSFPASVLASSQLAFSLHEMIWAVYFLFLPGGTDFLTWVPMVLFKEISLVTQCAVGVFPLLTRHLSLKITRVTSLLRYSSSLEWDPPFSLTDTFPMASLQPLSVLGSAWLLQLQAVNASLLMFF